MTTFDWNNLGFSYHKLPYRFIAKYQQGKWQKGELSKENRFLIEEGATALHYGQQCFEGLKAYRTKEGHVQLFRPMENAKRLEDSCRRLLMPVLPEGFFLNAVKEVVKANEEFVPPYGTGATLYLRPFIIGVGDHLGVAPAEEYLFVVFASPVGSYFKEGLQPANFLVTDYDRAAPVGTGGQKVGGNYAASMYPHELAKELGYADCIYLDPATHTKIEEVGAANFFGITHDNIFITPKSPSILPSITKRSLLYLAEHRLGLKVIEGDVFIKDIAQFKEAGACGTAAVITPIGGIQYHDQFHVFYSETKVSPLIQQLYDELVGIQFGDIVPPDQWIEQVL